MKKTFLLPAGIAGLLFLAACHGTPPDNPNQGNLPPGNGQRFNQVDLQKYADEANAAADKATLTKEQFQTELQTLRDAQRAKFQAQNPGGQPGNPRFGSGGSPRFGSGSRQGMGQQSDRLATAVTFLKYTDALGAENLIALDADGKVVMKWPMAFGGRGGPGGFGGGPNGQPPANTPPPDTGQ